MGLTFEFRNLHRARRGGSLPLAERPQMIAALSRAFPGLLGAWLARRDDGSWVDVILWHNRDEAVHAAKHVNGVPEAKAWFRHIAESHGLPHAEVAHEELFGLVRRPTRA
jgi:hypothetical protein